MGEGGKGRERNWREKSERERGGDKSMDERLRNGKKKWRKDYVGKKVGN